MRLRGTSREMGVKPRECESKKKMSFKVARVITYIKCYQ